jgi:hypothetical protein
MTIPRAWANGRASMPVSPSNTPMLTAADIAEVDGAEQRAVDKQVGGGTIAGPLTFTGSATLSLDDPNALLEVQGSINTANGGRAVLADDDFVQFSVARHRTVHASLLEGLINFTGGSIPVGPPNESIVGVFPPGVTPKWEWYADPPSCAMQAGSHDLTTDVSNSALIVPITRAHDGSNTLALGVYFAVDPIRTTLPTRYPGVSLIKVDPALGVVTQVSGWTYFPTAASVAAYKNGGISNRVFLTTSEVIDVDQYLYFFLVLDEDYGGVDTHMANIYSGFATTVTVADERFQ